MQNAGDSQDAKSEADDAAKIRSLENKLGKILEELKKDEEGEEKVFNSALKAIETIEQNEAKERDVSEQLLEKINEEGFPKKEELEVIKRILIEFMTHLNDLNAVADSLKIFAGQEKGFKLNATINNLQTAFRKGKIHNKWFFIPIITRISEKWDARKVAIRDPRKFGKDIQTAIDAEQQGDAGKVHKALDKVIDTFIDEDHHFEDLMSDIGTQISKFVEGDVQAGKDLKLDEDIMDKLETILRKHNLHEIKEARSDSNFLERFVVEFQRIKNSIDKQHEILADLLLKFKRGQSMEEEEIRKIAERVENLRKKIAVSA